MEKQDYNFEIPRRHKSIIKAIGVGGGGSNAVSHMYNQGIKDVEFIVCNTDVQALNSSPVPGRMQIGAALTQGLGAGANPEKGKDAALESKEEIRNMLNDGTKMVFITAGMGGGTGTGAAPVIAKIAKEMDILTVAIVTAPFSFEGRKKMAAANKGIDELRENSDTVLVILNDKLREIHGNLTVSKAFAEVDNILTRAAKGIVEIITVPSQVNVDFMDVHTVVKDAKAAVMGSAITEGEGRALRAAEMAINSPLLDNQDINGTQKILLSVFSGKEANLGIEELGEIAEYIQEKAGNDAEVILGHGIDANYGQSISVTVIATGFNTPAEAKVEAQKRTVIDLETNKEIKPVESSTIPPEHSQPSLFPVAEKPAPEPAQPKPKEENPKEDHSFVSALKGKYEVEEVPPKPPMPRQELEKEKRSPDITGNRPQEEQNKNPLELKKEHLMEQARKREECLMGVKNSELRHDDFKKQLDIPAYKRKQVKLNNCMPSSESNVSRYNLNDDDEIVSHNKFLHGNVD